MSVLYHAIEEIVTTFVWTFLYLTMAVDENLLKCHYYYMPTPTKTCPLNFTADCHVTVELGGRDERWSHTSETTPSSEKLSIIETPESPTTEWRDFYTSEPFPTSEVPSTNEAPKAASSEPENDRKQIILSYNCEYIAKNKVHMGQFDLYASHLSLDIGLKMQKKYPLTVLLHLR